MNTDCFVSQHIVHLKVLGEWVNSSTINMVLELFLPKWCWDLGECTYVYVVSMDSHLFPHIHCPMTLGFWQRWLNALFKNFFIFLSGHGYSSLYVCLYRLGEAEKALYHYKQSGTEANSNEIVQAQALQTHLNKCNEARKLKDWQTLLQEIGSAISSGADSAPQVNFLVPTNL